MPAALNHRPTRAPAGWRGGFAVVLGWLLTAGLGLSGCASTELPSAAPDRAVETAVPLPNPAQESKPRPAGPTEPVAVASAPESAPAFVETGPTPAADPAPSVASDAVTPPEAVSSDAEEDVLIARGLASWYGGKFHGRRTASGERYDMHALTAAHKTLPFGTRLRVRSVHTGKEVVVRINDRGPYKHQRIIDLSRAAMVALGTLERGVTEVELLRE